MFTIDRRLIACTAAALMLAACSKADDAANQPRQIDLAPAPAPQPALNDAPAPVAAAPAPAPRTPPRRERRPEPVPVPTPQYNAPTPAPVVMARTGIIASGTVLSVAPSIRVCTNTHKVGDHFTANVQNSVEGSNGAVIPAGATASMRVTESTRSEDSKNNIKLGFAIESIQIGPENYPVNGEVTQMAALDKVRAQSTGKQAAKVGGGAAIGALVGQLLGKNTKSTVIGGAVGAAAGGAVAAGTADYDGCVPTGTPMNVLLEQPLRIRVR